jgi:hypothetical protein
MNITSKLLHQNIFDNLYIIHGHHPFSIGGSMRFNLKSCRLKFRNFFRYVKGTLRHINFYNKYLLFLFWNIKYDDLESSSIVILFDITIDLYFCKLLSKYYSNNKRLIIFNWNIKNISQISFQKSLNFELWTFDKNDCQNYNIKYNKTFMAASIIPSVRTDIEIIKQDVFFIGSDKGRYKKLMEIKNLLETLSLSVKMIITELVESDNCNKISSTPMEYRDVLLEIIMSRCILDVPLDGQEGITQREMEALYFNKKLITTNRNVKNRDYYNPNNIYIIDSSNSHDDMSNFFNLPNVSVEKDVKNSYSVESWLQRFIQYQ